MNHNSEPYIWASALILRRLRKHRQLNQHEMAELYDIPFYTYARYENAWKQIDEKHLLKICQIHESTTTDFIEILYEETMVLTGQAMRPYCTEATNYAEERKR